MLHPPVVDPRFVEMVEAAVCGSADDAGTVEDRRVAADPHDFAGLYIRHRASFCVLARRFLRDARDVDEVVQEAFLRLFLALPELETELQALAYCRRTVTNLCIDRYRADQRRPRLVDIDAVPVDQLSQGVNADPVIQAEEAALVRLALSLLSPAHREALVKREIEEKSLPVIAAELNIPEESVKHLLFRARRALRRLLAGTQLQPGTDPELTSTLQLLVRRAASGGGKVAGVVAIMLIALGSGPNLHAIPLVGTDLPDIPSLLQLTKPNHVAPPVTPLPTSPSQLKTPTRIIPQNPVFRPTVPGTVATKPVPSLVVLPSPLVSPKVPSAPAPVPEVTPSPGVLLTVPSAVPSPATSPSAQPSSSPAASGSPVPKPSVSAPLSPGPSASPAASPAAPVTGANVAK